MIKDVMGDLGRDSLSGWWELRTDYKQLRREMGENKWKQ